MHGETCTANCQHHDHQHFHPDANDQVVFDDQLLLPERIEMDGDLYTYYYRDGSIFTLNNRGEYVRVCLQRRLVETPCRD